MGRFPSTDSESLRFPAVHMEVSVLRQTLFKNVDKIPTLLSEVWVTWNGDIFPPPPPVVERMASLENHVLKF